MTQQDYEKAKVECWEDYTRKCAHEGKSAYGAFCFAFDRAYALGKQEKDAEGEEMLTVPRKTVLEMFAANKRSKSAFAGTEIASESEQINHVLFSFFGSKCLPDNVDSSESNIDSSRGNVDSLEQKPVEPKFKAGDKVFNKLDCNVYEVICRTGFNYYALKDFMSDVHEDFLRPYTEPKEHIAENRNLSQDSANCDKQLDNILKDNFRDHNRLHVAATIAAGWLACHGMTCPETIAMDALTVADVLIRECEKGGTK